MAHLALPPAADFPRDPFVGQDYTAPAGQTYTWNGHAWDIGFYDNPSQDILTLAGLIDQIRTLLQDVDNSSGEYRYSTDSIVTCINQCMLDLFRVRPDLFLETGFVTTKFNVGNLNTPITIEEQYVPPIVYYAVGLVQARDDEQTQDARASAFIRTFREAVLTVS